MGVYAAIKRRYRCPWLLAVGLFFFHLILVGAWRHKIWMIVAGLAGVLGSFLSYPDAPKEEPELDEDGNPLPRKESWDDPAVRAGVTSFVLMVLISGLWMHNRWVTAISLSISLGYRLLVRHGKKIEERKAAEREAHESAAGQTDSHHRTDAEQE